LLNATFGNAVELIVGIIALKDGLIHIVQASLLGSILSNTLLVLGMCFFAGGVKWPMQKFNPLASGTGGTMLLFACFGVIVPAALRSQLTNSLAFQLPNVTVNESLYIFENETFYAQQIANKLSGETEEKILTLSRGIAIVLFCIYVMYLTFQLYSHKKYYDEGEGDGDSSEEEPKVNIFVAIIMLGVSTVLVAICSEYLVGSIEGLNVAWGLNDTFTGLILLPIVGNAAEHLSAVTFAAKNKMDLSIGIALGSSIQIALLVTPVMVLLGWIINQPMTLYFDSFETVVMFVSVLVVNSAIADGQSNWIEGAMLMGLYIIVAIACVIVGQ